MHAPYTYTDTHRHKHYTDIHNTQTHTDTSRHHYTYPTHTIHTHTITNTTHELNLLVLILLSLYFLRILSSLLSPSWCLFFLSFLA